MTIEKGAPLGAIQAHDMGADAKSEAARRHYEELNSPTVAGQVSLPKDTLSDALLLSSLAGKSLENKKRKRKKNKSKSKRK